MLFFLLLGVVILTVVVLFSLINSPTDNGEITNKNSNVENYIPFQVEATKNDLNQLIQTYIEKEGLNKSIKYDVTLTEQVELNGLIKVFGQSIELNMLFDPKIVDHGNLELQQTNMSIGRLPIPASYVLEFIQGSYDLPDWVVIQPTDEKVYIQFDQLTFKNGSKIKMNEFNLAKNDIQFTMYIPKK